MATTKEALLFYKDGQVKFTHIAVEDRQRCYREEVMFPEKISDRSRVEVEIHCRDFLRVQDIFGYAIFEEWN